MVGNIFVAIWLSVPAFYTFDFSLLTISLAAGLQLYQVALQYTSHPLVAFVFALAFFIICVSICNIGIIVLCQIPYALCGFFHGIFACLSFRTASTYSKLPE
jgi:hypothetical protein